MTSNSNKKNCTLPRSFAKLIRNFTPRAPRFQLSVARYLLGGGGVAALPESVEISTCTGVELIVDTSLGSLALNLGGWGSFDIVSI